MTGWLEIATVAFVAQLAVLPGEKVQFIIAGLSTRYSPWVVVSAAGTAFAGWTALEIWFGQALQDALSPLALDVLTAILFAAFAVLLLRSAPEPDAADGSGATSGPRPASGPGPASGAEPSDDSVSTEGPAKSDGGIAQSTPDVTFPTVRGRDLSHAFGGFLPIFTMMAVGEFGDKTQLITIALATKYGATSAIWAGEMAAILPMSLANAYFFHRFSGRFDPRKAHFFAAGLFGFFALDTVLAVLTGFSIWETLVTGVSDAIIGAM